MHADWHSRDELATAARKKLSPVDVVLDIGCGILPQTLITPLVHVCCEPYEEYARHLQEKANADPATTLLVLQLSWADAVKALPESSVDTVVLIDVIEHLDKEEGVALLKATERLARRQIVIFTPLGFMPQEHADGRDAWGMGGASWQRHRSGWTPDDFDESWAIVASREYHLTDNMGRVLERPFGAFYAIKTFENRTVDVEAHQALRRRIAAQSAAIADPEVLGKTADFVAHAARIYRPFMLSAPVALLKAEMALRDTWLGRLAYSILSRPRK